MYKIKVVNKIGISSTLPIGQNSVAYGPSSAKTGKLEKTVAISDPVPMSAIHLDFQSCMPVDTPLVEAAGSWHSSSPFPCDSAFYEVYVGPMGGADTTKYMIQTHYERIQPYIDACTITKSLRITLDLGTKKINETELITSINANFMPGDSLYGSCLDTMLSAITAVPGMQGPEEFIKCVINQTSTGVKEPSKKPSGIEKTHVNSMATKIIIGANGRIDPREPTYNIRGELVPNSSKLNPGVYIQK